MFTLGLAAIESFGTAHFGYLYLGTFLLDMALIEVLPIIFKRK